MKKLTLAVALMLATATPALAGGQEGSIGVGAELSLSQIVGSPAGGVSMNFDAGVFHVGGFLGLADAEGDDNTSLFVGGRFYYHIHSTLSSDFGLGGALSLASIDSPLGRDTNLFIEPGFQIRTFLGGSNVALSFTGGIVIGVADAGGVALGGQVTGVAGVHYYFF